MDAVDSVTYSVHQASFGYTTTPILHDINLTFTPGKVHGIVGPNGSGKSTLLDLMSGHRAPTQGNITIEETLLKISRRMHWPNSSRWWNRNSISTSPSLCASPY